MSPKVAATLGWPTWTPGTKTEMPGSMPGRCRLSLTRRARDGDAIGGGAPSTWPRKIKGDDGGCFAAALGAVRRWGGILEHPEASAAWATFRLVAPPRTGGWVRADWLDGHSGWTCCVEQGAYGHRARKATWLYVSGVDELPDLRWGSAEGDFVRMEDGFHSAEERARKIKTGACQRLSKNQRAATPIEFRDLLISIARTARGA